MTRTSVRLDGKTIGHIIGSGTGRGPFFYKPLTGTPGESFLTLAEVKRSIEG